MVRSDGVSREDGDEQTAGGTASSSSSTYQEGDRQAEEYPRQGHSDVEQHLQRRDDSALGVSTESAHEPTVPREPQQQIIVQETNIATYQWSYARALEDIFCLLTSSALVYRNIQMRLLHTWRPLYPDLGNDNIGNIIVRVREAEMGPELSSHDSEGFWSLPESFQPFLENRVPQINEQLFRQLTKAEVHAIQVTSGTWIDPVYPQYCTTASRLCSFTANQVQLNGVFLQSLSLATAGFFFTNGIVQCYHCGCSVREWEEGMSPVDEHRLISPRCRAVMNT